MLISFSKRYIFIANTKTASTTVERTMRQSADIALCLTRFGKHMSYALAMENFGFLLNNPEVPVESYFRFGVVREPLDWIVSWYNYRNRDALLSTPAKSESSTHGIKFEEFAEELMKPAGRRRPFARIGTQHAFFTAADGTLGVDYLIPLRRIDAELQVIGKELGIKKALTPDQDRTNVSPKIISAGDIAPDLAVQLREHFGEDMALFKRADEGGFGEVCEIIRRKRG